MHVVAAQGEFRIEGNDVTAPGTCDFPRVAGEEPVVRSLDLRAVGEDLLAEDAVLVAQAVADGGEMERRQRVDEASSETAQAAVAETRVGLLFHHRVELPALLLERAPHQRLRSEIHPVVT